MKVSSKYAPWMALAILCITYFLQQGTRQVYNATLPQIKADFASAGVSHVQLGMIATIFSLVYGVVVPFAGVAADLFGRRRLVVLALALFSAGIVASGFADGAIALVATYGVVAAAGQCMFPSSATSLISQFHPHTRATALSIFQSSLYVGVVVCSCVSGYLGGLGAGGWRTAFWTFGAAGLLWIPVVVFGLKEPAAEKADKAASVPAQEAKATAGEALLALVRRPSAVLLTVGFGMCTYGSRAFLTWTPDFMQEELALSPAQAGFHAVFWFYCGALAGIMCASRLTDRLAERRPAVRLEANAVGLLLCAPFVYFMSQTPSLALCGLSLALWGFAHGIYDSNFFASLYEVVSPRYRAAATGAFLCGGFVIGAFSPMVMGWMRDGLHLTLRDGFASVSLFYLVGAGVVLLARTVFFARDFAAQKNAETISRRRREPR